MDIGRETLENSEENLLLSTLSSSSHTFLQPSAQLHQDSLHLAKKYVDPLATATSEAQERRKQLARRKRKRGEPDPYDHRRTLRLKELHLEGFHISQVWEQAKRALDANREEINRSLTELLPVIPNGETISTSRKNDLGASVNSASASSIQQNGLHKDESADISLSESSEDESEKEQSDEAIEIDAGEPLALTDQSLSDQEDINDILNEDSLEESSVSDEHPKDVFQPDKYGLNDGFFSIDEFNRQSEFLEYQDARGEDDGAASDEEDVDWAADPSSVPTKQQQDGDDSEISDKDDEGPTFGNADLNGPDESDDDELSDDDMPMDNMGSTSNTNDILYSDFFAPPPRTLTKSVRRRALPKTQPPPQAENDDDVQRTISAVRRDIFEDDLTPSEGDFSDTNANKTSRSSHEKRQAALTAEIRRLEAAALAKRDWQLSGEARAADRPLNSLLEEDLEFERVGKPVPVITQEVSEDIESMIKRRILARDFDEVIRRRPGDLNSQQPSQQRRGLFELSTDKADQSLAEIYETEHLRRTDPAGNPSTTDKKLQADEAAVIALWKEVSSQLDALTSLHFRPKPPAADISVVADVPAIQMEDARPAGADGIGTAGSMLAPQEIYRAGEDEQGGKKKSETRTRGGMPVGREEMTREERKRRRRREKERIRKAGGERTANGNAEVAGKAGEKKSKRKEEKEDVVKDLKKSGVKVIGRKGELRDVDGKPVKNRQNGQGAGVYKL